MKKVVIIQARMTSSRLPGKVLKDLVGKPMLAQQLDRLKKCQMIDEIVIATTTNSTDDELENLAQSENLQVFRGDEQDVLGRYLGAARLVKADVIIRSTSDCPLIDAGVMDAVIKELVNNSFDCDYVSNTLERTYPRGLDVEAFFIDTLERLNRLGQSSSDREHVTAYIYGENKHYFKSRVVKDSEDNSDLRLTVDTEKDLELVRRLYKELSLDSKNLSYKEIIKYLRNNPELIEINKGIETWSPASNLHH